MMGKQIDYQSEYGEEYYEGFLGSQNTEKDANFKYFLSLILKEKRDIKSVLDLGCGKGGFLATCSQAGIENLYGVDISRYALSIAKKVEGAKFYQVNLEKDPLPFGNSRFDLAVAIDIAEHVKNVDNILSEVLRVLKPSGVFFMTTENTGSLFSILFSPFFKSHSGHINLQKAAVWEKTLKKHGFLKIKLKGIVLHGFPPLVDLRNILRKLKIPVVAHPIVFPIRTLCGTIVISARKK